MSASRIYLPANSYKSDSYKAKHELAHALFLADETLPSLARKMEQSYQAAAGIVGRKTRVNYATAKFIADLCGAEVRDLFVAVTYIRKVPESVNGAALIGARSQEVKS